MYQLIEDYVFLKEIEKLSRYNNLELEITFLERVEAETILIINDRYLGKYFNSCKQKHKTIIKTPT